MEDVKFNAKAYRQAVNAHMPRSDTARFCWRAFWVGGTICCIGEGIRDLLNALFVLDESGLAAATAILLVFLGALLTGLGVYDRIGAYAGAGSVVPITGFANSVVAPAIEFRPEGLVMGVGAKMFQIAGPVLVYGIGSSVLIGIIYFLLGR